MEPGLIEQGENYSMQCCESLQKKQYILHGSLSGLEGSGKPKASLCGDDHLLKFTVLKDRKIRLHKQQNSRFQKTTISRKTITRKLYNAGFVSIRCFKKPLLSQKNIKDRIKFLPEYGKFDSEWFSRVESRFQSHADAPERCVRSSGEKYNSECISPLLSMEEKMSWCGKPFQLLVLVSCFTVKSQLMLWNTGEYCRKACFPQLKCRFLKRCNFSTRQLPTLQRPSKSPSDMFWPSQSPDLKPLENIWSHIKPHVYLQGLSI